MLLIEKLDEAPITSVQIANWAKQDPVLAKVLQYILLGWPSIVNDALKPYWNRRFELSTHAGCILWGVRVIVPSPGQQTVLAELHGGHPGITWIKALACHLVWWPKLDEAVEDVVKQCDDCQQS